MEEEIVRGLETTGMAGRGRVVSEELAGELGPHEGCLLLRNFMKEEGKSEKRRKKNRQE